MIETAIALLLAHVLADYPFQTNWMVANKRKPGTFALHGAVVFVLSLAALGGSLPLALGVTLAHLAMDAVKLWALPDRLASYLADQGVHVAIILAAAWIRPDAIAEGLWSGAPASVWHAAILITGLIATTMAGGPAVGLLMRPYQSEALPEGLTNAGRRIGELERALIFLMVAVGEPAGIGFLIAAKSILRFDTAKDQKAGEYVIIGTLASFGWALTFAFLTQAALRLLENSPALP